MTCRTCRSATPDTASLGTNGDTDALLLTVEEAAQRLRVGRTVCFRLISSGELESILVGQLRRVPADAVPAYILKRRTANRLQEVAR